jgi:hypothetical protein
LPKAVRYKEIAGQLFVLQESIHPNICNIYEKLQVDSWFEASKKWIDLTNIFIPSSFFIFNTIFLLYYKTIKQLK